MQPSTAASHGLAHAQHIPKPHIPKQRLHQRRASTQADFLARQLISGKALAPFAGGMQKAAAQRHAHIAADIGRGGLPIGKHGYQPRLNAIVIIAKGMADIINSGFIQRFHLHRSHSISCSVFG